jgi:hypothetical protein
MATLYSDPEWSSKNLEPAIFEARRHAVKDKMPALFPDQLCKFREELRQRSQEGYKVTLTDFWGLLIESCLGDEVVCLCVCLSLSLSLSLPLSLSGVWTSMATEVRLDLQMHPWAAECTLEEDEGATFPHTLWRMTVTLVLGQVG